MIDIRLSDNLELMAEMQDNTVDLIYCDILYGTGRKFKDYQDLKPKREVIEQHYLPRIKEMKRILKDTGSIYFQMDTRINHWVRCLMDDVFGYKNLINEIIWAYSGRGSNSKNFTYSHQNIYLYSKTTNYTFNSKDIEIPYKLDTIKRANRKIQGVNYVKNKTGKVPETIWYIPKLVNNQFKKNLIYDTQKPKALIERIIKASSNEGDLVADFYGGSFTTAEVCKDLNRSFIGCDISEKAVAIGLERTKYFR